MWCGSVLSTYKHCQTFCDFSRGLKAQQSSKTLRIFLDQKLIPFSAARPRWIPFFRASRPHRIQLRTAGFRSPAPSVSINDRNVRRHASTAARRRRRGLKDRTSTGRLTKRGRHYTQNGAPRRRLRPRKSHLEVKHATGCVHPHEPFL